MKDLPRQPLNASQCAHIHTPDTQHGTCTGVITCRRGFHLRTFVLQTLLNPRSISETKQIREDLVRGAAHTLCKSCKMTTRLRGRERWRRVHTGPRLHRLSGIRPLYRLLRQLRRDLKVFVRLSGRFLPKATLISTGICCHHGSKESTTYHLPSHGQSLLRVRGRLCRLSRWITSIEIRLRNQGFVCIQSGSRKQSVPCSRRAPRQSAQRSRRRP